MMEMLVNDPPGVDPKEISKMLADCGADARVQTAMAEIAAQLEHDEPCITAQSLLRILREEGSNLQVSESLRGAGGG